jgi:hypothetical protein
MKALVLCAAALLLVGCDLDETTTSPSQTFNYRDTGSIGQRRTKASTGVITDIETGCQYIVTAWREVSLTPRLGADGKPICRK